MKELVIFKRGHQNVMSNYKILGIFEYFWEFEWGYSTDDINLKIFFAYINIFEGRQ